jgi:glycosidase
MILLALALQSLDLVDVDFTLTLNQEAKQVSVAGTFNGWQAGKDLLVKDADGRTWRGRPRMNPGKIYYKFVIDGTWIVDPANAQREDDGNGNVNSFLFIQPRGFEKPGKVGDGLVTREALKHLATIPDLNYDRGRLIFKLRVRSGDVQNVRVIVNGAKPINMVSAADDGTFATYEGSTEWSKKSDLSYHFEVVDGTTAVNYPTSSDFVCRAKEFRSFETPKWVERAVFYQIFPDRFMNGNRENDPKDVMPWDGQPTWFNRFGGDLAGVDQRTPYLRSLGISAIYFNPVFKSPSNHRYDTSDYFQVDPQLGSNNDLARLVAKLRRQGIKVVLDGVFNHTATDFFAFDDVVKKQAASPYTHWYRFHGFPVVREPKPNYEAWAGFGSMPKLDLSNKAVSDYMLKIPEYWQKLGVAGWRLDVANEVDPAYWVKFRDKVKKIDPEAYIVGEDWGDRTDWLRGDQWDAKMNYLFRSAVLKFVGTRGSGKPSDLLDGLFNAYANYAPQSSRVMFNILGSHDTPRILHEVGEKPDLAKLAAMIQFTWVGAPSIYYGEEIGMTGGGDPENRRGMNWDLVSPGNDILLTYRKLVRLRRNSTVLQSGDPVRLEARDSDGIASFARTYEGASAVVVLNRSSQPKSIQLSLPTSLRIDDMTQKQGFVDGMTLRPIPLKGRTLDLTVPSAGAVIAIPAREGRILAQDRTTEVAILGKSSSSISERFTTNKLP